METGVTKAALEYEVREHTEKIAIITTLILVVLLALLIAILLRSLAPLKQLRESVRAIINGQLGIQTLVRGRDEVAEIGRVFNQMSVSIESKVNELTDLNQGYYKFVPSKMFSLLRKSSVIDVRLGDQTNEEITILSFNAVRFEEMVSTMTGEEMFRMINRVFSNLVPLVNNNGGVVDKFENAGLVAFYTDGNERALNTAISVCQTMDSVNAEQSFGAGRQIEMASGLSYGPVKIGIVGHQERLAATTISEHTNLSGYLRKIAPKYGSRILTTASVISQINNFDEKYNARFVGFLHISVNDTIEKLYDVFDGDREDKKLFKKQTKELFEKGVSLYCQKEFYEARLVFIEVLKQFRQDAAAKEYLYRCDRYYQSPDADTTDIFIESY
jgi:class 3 adenylate cyclase/HAMP domain-containing protein